MLLSAGGYDSQLLEWHQTLAFALLTGCLLTLVLRQREGTATVAGAYNVVYVVRDVFADGFGGEAGSNDACPLFNILHCEEPVRLLVEAARVVRPGGEVLVIHWRCDPATPRRSRMDIRPQAGRIVEWAEATGLLETEGAAIELPPWHYGLRLRRGAGLG
jgi:SAM-dependent methyltransferase